MKTRSRIQALVVAAATACLLLPSCGGRPDKVLSDRKMASLVADLELADAYAGRKSEFSGDSVRKVLFQSILAQHGVTQEEYDATIDYYGHNLDKYGEMLMLAQNQLKKRAGRLSDDGEEGHAAAEGTGLWPYRSYLLVSPLASDPGIRFSIDKSELGKGDQIVWRLRFSEMGQGDYLLGVDYDDGSIGYVTNPSGQGLVTELRLQTDTAKTVKRIFGHVGFPQSRKYVWVDSISLVNKPFDKEVYRYTSGQKTFVRPEAKPKKQERNDTLRDVAGGAPARPGGEGVRNP